MTLEDTRDCFEALGRTDPLGAVLSWKRRSRNRWDPQALFETGRKEIGGVLEYLERLGLDVGRHRALDFGCAVGRLTQPLADSFENVVGVDIAESFVEQARRYNRRGDRCRYVVNTSDNLAQFGDGEFDFVYSNITLQHIPPEHAVKYVAEFIRVLRAHGVAVFQAPCGLAPYDGTVAWVLRRLRWRFVTPARRWWKRRHGRPVIPMFGVPRREVERAVRSGGGRIVDVVEDSASGKGWISLRYCGVKGGS
jgi:SAM-dependent methyltransferase